MCSSTEGCLGLLWTVVYLGWLGWHAPGIHQDDVLQHWGMFRIIMNGGLPGLAGVASPRDPPGWCAPALRDAAGRRPPTGSHQSWTATPSQPRDFIRWNGRRSILNVPFVANAYPIIFHLHIPVTSKTSCVIPVVVLSHIWPCSPTCGPAGWFSLVPG